MSDTIIVDGCELARVEQSSMYFGTTDRLQFRIFGHFGGYRGEANVVGQQFTFATALGPDYQTCAARLTETVQRVRAALAPQPAPAHELECDKPGCLVVHAPVETAPAAGEDEVERVARELPNLEDAYSRGAGWVASPGVTYDDHLRALQFVARYALSLRPSASNATIEEAIENATKQTSPLWGAIRHYGAICETQPSGFEKVDYAAENVNAKLRDLLRSLFVASNESGGKS